MIPSYTSVLEALNDPQRYHAMLVHLPVAIGVLGVVMLIGLMISGGRSAALRWTTVAVYVIGAVVAFLAAEAGEAAHHEMDSAMMTTAAIDAMAEHEELGEKLWMVMLIPAALVAATSVRVKAVRGGALVLACVGGLFAGGWVALTGHYGGELVYMHGAGVPTSMNNVGEVVDEPVERPSEDGEHERHGE
jgi:uncharacterized membrane protein